jgi:hypothetical protein
MCANGYVEEPKGQVNKSLTIHALHEILKSRLLRGWCLLLMLDMSIQIHVTPRQSLLNLGYIASSFAIMNGTNISSQNLNIQ